jgi:hypothetical protein
MMKKQAQYLITLTLLAVLSMTLTNLQLNAQVVSGSGKKQIIAQTPPLGWNSFDSYGVNIYEEVAMKEIDAFIEKFAPHGYEYFVIDNGWFASPKSQMFKGYLVPVADKTNPVEVTVNEYGIPVPSKQYFPNGLKPMIDKLHAKGLKFGVHLMRGIPRIAVEKNLPIKGTKFTAKDIHTTFNDCTWCIFMHGVDMTKPGSQEYYNSVFKQFAEWEIDFVKVDDVTHFAAEIEGYVKAIENCGRPIVLSLSAGGTSNVKYLETYRKTNMVRTTPDIWDEQIALERSFESMRKWQGLEQPGFWPDLDMIPFGELCILRRPELKERNPNQTLEEFMGKMHHWCKFTNAQKETFITQRAIAASPIMIGGSMISMDDHSYKLLTNPEMLACVKNGVHGKLFHAENQIELWSAPIGNNERWGFQEYMFKNGWAAFFNRSDKAQTFDVKGKFLNFMQNGTYSLKDIWGNQSVENYKKGSPLSLTTEPNGVVFFKYSQVQK